MLLAVARMSPEVELLFFLVAVILFALAAFQVAIGRINVVAAGLFFFAFPYMWNALSRV